MRFTVPVATATADADLGNHSVDELGKCALLLHDRLMAVGFRQLVAEVRGQSCLHPRVGSLSHPAAPLLDHLRRVGAPVLVSSPPPTLAEKDEAIRRGCHGSAREYAEFLRTEILDFVRKGFFIVLPYSSVRHMRRLRLAPMGVVPQRNRRPRAIVDYSWHGLNDSTVPLAPDSMQFGRALQRVLQHIYDAHPQFGPVYMCKIDIADGFYRVGIQADDAPNLGVILPSLAGAEQLIAIPTVLPMGRVASPPYFCAVTETVADLANESLQAEPPLTTTPHRLDQVADTPPPPDEPFSIPTLSQRMHPPEWQSPQQQALAYVDVYMDDFLGVAQGTPQRRTTIRRAIFSALDRVLRPLATNDNPLRQEPASIRKLMAGDGAWHTRKVILGWMVDSVQGTLTLPPHRQQCLLTILAETQAKRRVSLSNWRKVVGELRSMTIALPGSEGLFAHLQEAMAKASTQRRITINSDLHDALADWDWLASNISQRPTSLAEVVGKPISWMGACDASAAGMGGVWFDASGSNPPLFWRHRFPTHVTRRVISHSNPTGDLTNSDLE